MKHGLLLSFCCVVLTGCASLNCAAHAPGGEPGVELAYVSGGDGPTVTLLRVYSSMARTPGHALLEIEPLGLRRSCRHVQGSEVLQVKASLKGLFLSGLVKDEAQREHETEFHEPLLGVRTPEVRLWRPPAKLSPSLLTVVTPIEALFLNAFPRITDRFLPFRISEVVSSA